MAARSFEGILVALVSQRGADLIELLREAARRTLVDRDLRYWTIEFGQLNSPLNGVTFRLSCTRDNFPWRDGAGVELARLVSKLGHGKCWSLAMEKGRGSNGWAEGAAYEKGERTGFEESTHGLVDLLAWFGEQMALSENEVLALFESCDQSVGLIANNEKMDEEIDQILERARKEYQRYRQLKEASLRQKNE